MLWLCNPSYIADVVIPEVRPGANGPARDSRAFDIVAGGAVRADRRSRRRLRGDARRTDPLLRPAVLPGDDRAHRLRGGHRAPTTPRRRARGDAGARSPTASSTQLTAVGDERERARGRRALPSRRRDARRASARSPRPTSRPRCAPESALSRRSPRSLSGTMLVLLGFAVLAGAGTALSPCVLPVLPALLSAGGVGGRRRPLGIVLGLSITFTVTIVGIAKVVDGVGLGSDPLRDVAIVVLLVFGAGAADAAPVPSASRRRSRAWRASARARAATASARACSSAARSASSTRPARARSSPPSSPSARRPAKRS